MPYVKTSRSCIRCGKTPGMLYGVEGQSVSPNLCATCFNGGKGVLDTMATWFKRLRA